MADKEATALGSNELFASTLTVAELVRELALAIAEGHEHSRVMISHPSSGNPEQRVSGIFPLIGVDLEHGVCLIQRNRIAGYVPKVFPMPSADDIDSRFAEDANV